MNLKSGSCTCGEVKFEVKGDPVRIHNCHCKLCQRVTGSSFNLACYFPKESINLLSGELITYTRGSDSGRKIDFHFCKLCGTTIIWDVEASPNHQGLAGGTFDDTDWIENPANIWCESKQNWYELPNDSEKKRKGRNSDDFL